MQQHTSQQLSKVSSCFPPGMSPKASGLHRKRLPALGSESSLPRPLDQTFARASMKLSPEKVVASEGEVATLELQEAVSAFLACFYPGGTQARTSASIRAPIQSHLHISSFGHVPASPGPYLSAVTTPVSGASDSSLPPLPIQHHNSAATTANLSSSTSQPIAPHSPAAELSLHSPPTSQYLPVRPRTNLLVEPRHLPYGREGPPWPGDCAWCRKHAAQQLQQQHKRHGSMNNAPLLRAHDRSDDVTQVRIKEAGCLLSRCALTAYATRAVVALPLCSVVHFEQEPSPFSVMLRAFFLWSIQRTEESLCQQLILCWAKCGTLSYEGQAFEISSFSATPFASGVTARLHVPCFMSFIQPALHSWLLAAARNSSGVELQLHRQFELEEPFGCGQATCAIMLYVKH
eukprot:1155099-Pelagomonas_calceolata.AAC.6